MFARRIWEQARKTEAFGELMEFEIARARRYYRESAPLLGLIAPKSRASLWALIAIYSGCWIALRSRITTCSRGGFR